MKKISLIGAIMLLSLHFAIAQSSFQFDNVAIPANPGNGKVWQLQRTQSDDFNYTFNPTGADTDFGPAGVPKKWNNFYQSAWSGPAPTVWKRNHVRVRNGRLELWADRVAGERSNVDGVSYPTTRAGCVTSKKPVQFPFFVETRVRIMNSVLASDFWLLSQDATQELDILEAYGGTGTGNRNSFFADRLHLSHHVFTRVPFRDYQPADENTFWRRTGVNSWGNKWVRIGIHQVSPRRIEYYIDGRLERIVDDKAVATRLPNGTWRYAYPDPAGYTGTGINGKLIRDANGRQKMKTASSLQDAKNKSRHSMIDPFNYLANGRQINKQLNIIVNIEDQSWRAPMGLSPTQAELNNRNNNTLLVDWIRVYKPVASSGGGNNGAQSYFIVNRQTGKKLRVSDKNSGSKLNMGAANWTGNQNKWTRVNSTNGFFYLRNVHSGMYFRPENNNDGSRLIQRPTSFSGTYTQWKTVNTSNGYFYLVNRATGKRFSPVSNVDLSEVQQRPTSAGGNWTQWIFTAAGNSKSVDDTKVDKSGFDFYPNPASSSISIKTGTSGYDVNIHDMSGRLVKSVSVSKNTIQEISISKFNAGIYLMRYKADDQNETFTKKLIVE